MRTHKLTTIAVVGSALLFVTGCSTGDVVAAPTPTTPSALRTPTETSDPTPNEAAPPVETPIDETVEPTCENIVTADRLAELHGYGLVPTIDSWTLRGGVEGDILCTWDVSSPPSAADSHPQYGWAQLTEAEEALVIEAMKPMWDAPEGSDGVLMFVSPNGPMKDADGFGATYIFSGGTVHYANTKADALTVVDPH